MCKQNITIFRIIVLFLLFTLATISSCSSKENDYQHLVDGSTKTNDTYIDVKETVDITINNTNIDIKETDGTIVDSTSIVDESQKINITYPNNYTVIKIGKGVGAGESYVGTGDGNYLNSSYDYEKVESFKKDSIPKGDAYFEIFGETFRLFYSETIKSTLLRTYNLDWYYAHYDGGYYSLFLNENTGHVVRFTNSIAGKDRDFKSTVNPYSNENEFLEYVKSILLDYSGLSITGWDYSISTTINSSSVNQNDEGKELDGFISYIDHDPSFNANYIFTFYKTINSIKRADSVSVKINNTGEVMNINAETYEDVFFPFEGAYIDLIGINNIEKLYENSICNTYNVTTINSEHKLVAMSNELFVEVTVNYEHAVIDGDRTYQLGGLEKYLIKVAEYSIS